MKKQTYSLQEAINTASREGFKVRYSDDPETLGWWVTTPKRPRHPSEEHGAFKDETRAWMAAALMANSL
jgi:hypothetical protein